MPPLDRSAARLGTLRGALTVALLAIAVLAAHGWCLGDGTVLDDWQHQKHLREHGWSLPELQRSLTIRPADWVEHWWQTKEVRWEYARPLFILTMKTIYHVLGGDDPFWLHAYSLLLHFACAVMVWRLTWLLSRDAFWSGFAGLLFVVYPHAVMTVQWSSSQNCVQQTAFTLAALLLYVRASGLNVFERRDEATERRRDVVKGNADCSEGSRGNATAHSVSSSLRFPVSSAAPLVGCFLFWLIALFTKENALLLPPIVVAFDLAFGGWRHVRARLPVYAMLAGLGGVFLVWRAGVISVGMPDVYFRRPAGDWPQYCGWCAAKLLHYVTTSIWPAPMTIGPTGRLNPWTDATGDCLLMLGIVTILGAGYALATRQMRGWWIWPAWILLAVLPVTPVIATAHSGYLGGVGYAISVALAAVGTRGALPSIQNPKSKIQNAAIPVKTALGARLLNLGARAAAFGALASMSVLTLLNRWQWTGVIAAERWVPAWIQADPPDSRVTDVFFLNLPFLNIYAKPQLNRLLDPSFEAVRAHVLTYAPQPIMPEQRVTIVPRSATSFSLAVEGQPYFSRLLGRFLLEGFGQGRQFRTGEIVTTDRFNVRIVAADAEGVRELEFSFPKPLDSPEYCFYLTTETCGAARLQFNVHAAPTTSQTIAQGPRTAGEIAALRARLEVGDASAMLPLLAAVSDEENPLGRDARSALQPVAVHLAVVTGSQVQRLLLGPHLDPDPLAPPPRIRGPQPIPPPPSLSAAQWAEVAHWWQSSITDEQLTLLWSRRGEFEHFIKAREELPHARQWAALIGRTDLYLTGPPFPGPRP
jgi:hypothetical protein